MLSVIVAPVGVALSLWKLLSVIGGCNAFAGPVFEMEKIFAEMNCMVVESTFKHFENAIQCIASIGCTPSFFFILRGLKKQTRSKCCAACDCAYFLQFNLATLKYVTDIAFIDAVMRLQCRALAGLAPHPSSLKWRINCVYLEGCNLVTNEMQTFLKCGTILEMSPVCKHANRESERERADLCQICVHISHR